MQRLGILVWGIVALVMGLMMTLSILRGGFFEMMRLAAMLLPVLFILLINIRSKWHVLILTFLPVHMMTLPMYGLHALGPSLLLLAAVTAIMVIDKLIHVRRERMATDTAVVMMMVLAVIYTLRFIYDRPGVVGFGMAKGGFSSALYAVLAGWFFFTMRAVMGEAVITKRQLAFVGIVSLLFNAHVMRTSVLWGVFRWYQELGDAPTWMACAAILSLLAPNLRRGIGLPFYLAACGFMGLAALSAHRSRILFMLAIILTVAWFAGRFKRVTAVMVVMASLAVMGAIAMGGGRLPPVVARSLSLVMPERYWQGASRLGPMGWEDTFRTEMAEVAWASIRTSPWVGTGLGFELEEALRVLAVGGTRVQFDMLALGKSFHNTFLIVATDVGLPAVLAYILASLLILFRFVRRTRALPMDAPKMWHMTLIGFWIANFFMAMINGGYYELFNGCVVLGAMSGMMVRERLAQPVAAPYESPRIVPKDSGGAQPAAFPRPAILRDRG